MAIKTKGQATSNSMIQTIGSWTRLHAGLLVFATLIAILIDNLTIVAGAATISLVYFAYICEEQWKKLGRFGGPANLVTTIRITILIALLIFYPKLEINYIFVIAFIAWALDLLDGFLARNYNSQSLFGEYLDKETDAFLGLALSLILHKMGILGFWIIFPGLLRYIYVLVTIFYVPAIQKEKRFKIGRWIAGFFMGGLVAGFILPGWFHLPSMIVISLVLCLSFLNSFLHLKRPEQT